jgi:hypothetical protein
VQNAALLFLVAAACHSCMSGNIQAIKTIEKNGLERMAKEAGLDLNSLPFRCGLLHVCPLAVWDVSRPPAASAGTAC